MKHLRLIENILRNEETMNKKFEEQQQVLLKDQSRFDTQKVTKLQFEKKRNEEIRIREIKKKQMMDSEEEQNKKAAQELFKRNLKGMERQRILEEQRQREVREKMI